MTNDKQNTDWQTPEKKLQSAEHNSAKKLMSNCLLCSLSLPPDVNESYVAACISVNFELSHFLTLNISEMAKDTAIVTVEGE